MKNYAHVADGVVDNVALFNDEGPPPDWPDFANWHQSDVAQIGWTYTGGEFSPPPPPPPSPPAPTTAVIYAICQITLAGGEVSSVTTSANLAGVLRLDVGKYWVFFAQEQEDTSYLALAYDSGTVRAYIDEADKFVDYFVVTITDFAGNPVDPAGVSVEVKRVI